MFAAKVSTRDQKGREGGERTDQRKRSRVEKGAVAAGADRGAGGDLQKQF